MIYRILLAVSLLLAATNARIMRIVPSDEDSEQWPRPEGGEKGDEESGDSMCSSVKTVGYKPTISSNRNGTRVEVRQDELLSQLFTVEECVSTGQSCRWTEDEDEFASTCVTRVGWRVALVRPKGSSGGDWHLDYIFLPAGCQCRASVVRRPAAGEQFEWIEK